MQILLILALLAMTLLVVVAYARFGKARTIYSYRDIVSWNQIDEHRKKARQISFDILLWGPSAEDGSGYNLRLSIKNHLAQNGHSAKFSEELYREGEIPPPSDPELDEILHAEAANLIVVLYGSRGSQTEVEKILFASKRYASKALVVLSESMWSNIMKGLSAVKWQRFKGEILKLPDTQMEATDICHALDQQIENFQFAEYLRRRLRK